jgi:hypothetical protein
MVHGHTHQPADHLMGPSQAICSARLERLGRKQSPARRGVALALDGPG